MYGFLCATDDTPFLAAELSALGCRTEQRAPGLLTTAQLPTSAPKLVFARQHLPELQPVTAGSIRRWAQTLADFIRGHCPPDQPWRLHLVPHYETVQSTHAGENRCRLVADALREELRKSGWAYRKYWQPASDQTFSPTESLVQLVLTEPEAGWFSLATAPMPAQGRFQILPFPGGEIPVAQDRAAPSRAFAKLLEAEVRLGRRIGGGETVVDLGACPGSWSYVALARGARVIAVDRTPVRGDLLANSRLHFEAGDAFKYRPDAPVDWLICDVIAAPERSVQLVLDWVQARWCRNFIVTIKFRGHDEYHHLDRLKSELPSQVEDFGMARLCANKNEACVFGTSRAGNA